MLVSKTSVRENLAGSNPVTPANYNGAAIWDRLDLCKVDGRDRYPVAPPYKSFRLGFTPIHFKVAW